jgi:phosphoglycerate dehydrogenase-like enzyme
MKTLLVGDIDTYAHNLLEAKTQLTKITNEEFTSTTSFPEFQAIVLRTYTTLKKEDLDKLPLLKFVVSCSVGINNLDVEELKLRNIELVHCPGTNANSVAEHTLYLLLSTLREDTKKPYAELKGKTMGIIGLGYIGKLVAQKLLGFDLKVIAFDVIKQDQAVLEKLNVTMEDFETVFKESDIVTIHVPLNKHTANLVNKSAFEKMKQGSFFINTSREEVINEGDLITFFNQGKFRGIALDVCSAEFTSKINKGNVIVTDHVAAQGEDSFKNMCQSPIDEFLKRI